MLQRKWEGNSNKFINENYFIDDADYDNGSKIRHVNTNVICVLKPHIIFYFRLIHHKSNSPYNQLIKCFTDSGLSKFEINGTGYLAWAWLAISSKWRKEWLISSPAATPVVALSKRRVRHIIPVKTTRESQETSSKIKLLLCQMWRKKWHSSVNHFTCTH